MLRAAYILKQIKANSLKKVRIAGDAAQRERNWTKAIESYKRFLSSRPDNAAIWIQIGHAYKELKQFDQAEAAYREALRAEPDDKDAVLHLSTMLHSLGREQDALALAPTSLEEGTTFHNLDAAATSRQVARIVQISNSQRGDLARDNKDWSSAAVFYSRHLKEHPQDGGIWTQFGHVLKEQLLFDDALFAYQVARRFESASSDVSLHLAALLMRMGRTIDATPMWASMFSEKGSFFLHGM